MLPKSLVLRIVSNGIDFFLDQQNLSLSTLRSLHRLVLSDVRIWISQQEPLDEVIKFLIVNNFYGVIPN